MIDNYNVIDLLQDLTNVDDIIQDIINDIEKNDYIIGVKIG